MASSDLDVRHKLALSWAYDVPKVKTENRVLKAVLDGYQLGSVFLAQTGQPVTLQSGVDSNANGDSAGDRVVFNPNGVGNTGTDVFAVCEAVTGTASGSPVGRVYVGTVGFTSAATNGCAVNNNPNTAQNPFGFDPAIGYTPIDKNAKYAVAGLGVRTTVGRNSLTTPGFGVLNLSLGKKFFFGEGKYLLAKADVFNILNHPNFALSNGNIFSTAGVTTATTTQGFALPTDPQFSPTGQVFQRRDSLHDPGTEAGLLSFAS